MRAIMFVIIVVVQHDHTHTFAFVFLFVSCVRAKTSLVTMFSSRLIFFILFSLFKINVCIFLLINHRLALRIRLRSPDEGDD